MEVKKTALEGVVILRPRYFEDERGYFVETYSQRMFDKEVQEVQFVQDNESKSSYGVIRGLHFQRPPYTQAKLVRCVAGVVRDVVVDLRKGSPTYGQHTAVELSGENREMLFIPHGFAHGFSVLSPTAVFQYKCDNFYHPEADAGINLRDSMLGIDWGIDPEQAILSEKDLGQPLLAEFESPFTYHENC